MTAIVACAPRCRDTWRALVSGDFRQRALPAFEVATLLKIRRGLKSGRLWLTHSAAYRDPALHLIDAERWERERRHHQTKLGLPSDAHACLDVVRGMLNASLSTLSEAVAEGRVQVTDGLLRIGSLKAEPLPATTECLKPGLFRDIGSAQLPEVMLDVDAQTRFSWELLGRAPRSGHELVALYAGLIAHGTPMDAAGVARMIPGLSAEQVRGAMASLESKEAMREANQSVVGLLRAQPVT